MNLGTCNDKLNACEGGSEEIKTLKEKLNQEATLRSQCERNLLQCNADEDRALETIATLQAKLKATEESLRGLVEKFQTVSDELWSSQQISAGLNASLGDAKAQIAQLKDNNEALRKEQEDLRARNAMCQVDLENVERENKVLKESIANGDDAMKAALESAEASLKECEVRFTNATMREEEATRNLGEVQSNLDATERELEQCTSDRTQISSQLARASEEAQRLRDELSGLAMNAENCSGTDVPVLQCNSLLLAKALTVIRKAHRRALSHARLGASTRMRKQPSWTNLRTQMTRIAPAKQAFSELKIQTSICKWKLKL